MAVFNKLMRGEWLKRYWKKLDEQVKVRRRGYLVNKTVGGIEYNVCYKYYNSDWEEYCGYKVYYIGRQLGDRYRAAWCDIPIKLADLSPSGIEGIIRGNT